MTEHPAIAAMMNTGYLYAEPIQFSKCISCGIEINMGDDYIDHAGNDFCEMDCLSRTLIEEGNAVRRVAGE